MYGEAVRAGRDGRYACAHCGMVWPNCSNNPFYLNSNILFYVFNRFDMTLISLINWIWIFVFWGIFSSFHCLSSVAVVAASSPMVVIPNSISNHNIIETIIRINSKHFIEFKLLKWIAFIGWVVFDLLHELIWWFIWSSIAWTDRCCWLFIKRHVAVLPSFCDEDNLLIFQCWSTPADDEWMAWPIFVCTQFDMGLAGDQRH